MTEKIKTAISNRAVLGWLVILAAGLGLWQLAQTDTGSQEAAPVMPTRSCETWERMYGVVESHTVPSDTFEVGRNETWVVSLEPDRWSDWIRSNRKYWWLGVGQPLLWLETPDGREFRVTQDQHIVLSRWKQLRLKGDGCVLFTTNERVFDYWDAR